MARKLTKVNINSITVKDDDGAPDPALLINWNYPQKNDSEISEIVLVLRKNVIDTVSIQVGQTVDVWDGFSTSTDTKRFSGFVSNFKAIGQMYEVTCKDNMWDLVRQTVNTVYLSSGAQAGQVSAIAEDLIETHGGLTASFVATGTSAGQTIDEFRCDHTQIYERLIVLARAVRYQLYFDAAADTVNFETRGKTNNGVILTTGTEIIDVPQWEDDDSMMVNDLRIDGAVIETNLRFPTSGTGKIGTTANFDTTDITLPFTPESAKLTIDAADPPTTIREGGGVDSSTNNYFYIDKENKNIMPASGTTFTTDDFAFVDYTWLAPHPIHQVRELSKTTYGTYKKELVINDIKSVADAESRTKEILDRFSEPFRIATFLVKDNNSVSIDVGDLVRVIDTISNPNVDAEFVVTKIVKRYPGDFQEVTVGDEGIRLSDWSFSVEERLKRLEERNLSNEDLLTELRDFVLTNFPETRYFRAFKEDYDSGSGNSIWNLGSGDGYFDWGAGKWGTDAVSFPTAADHFIMQYLNSYTENFLDTDFKSTNTTATWGSTGSVTFTASQIAESTSVDFANGTITAATLTSTEVSGSFNYEMTADGSNWESVTSGTAHTFSNTGTDLRWRATENNISTGEISKVTIQNYH